VLSRGGSVADASCTGNDKRQAVLPNPLSPGESIDSYDGFALHDTQMLEEIELLGDLIVLASNSTRRLSVAEIDAVLRLTSSSSIDVPA
jgi:hypothetical protein